MTELKVAELVGFGKGETTDSKGLTGANGKPDVVLQGAAGSKAFVLHA